MTRSAAKVMGKLIGLVKPLIHIMAAAILMGVAGYLCASFITIFGGMGLLKAAGFHLNASIPFLIAGMLLFAVMRGILRYMEQACNHYIAFKLLALIRHKVFVKLRTLAPAKLEGKEKGNLISLITSDIELLEVFYAHTISPIAIAVITSVIMVIFTGRYHFIFGIISGFAYITVGAVLPFLFSKIGSNIGQQYRNDFGKMNGFFYDSIRGIKDSIQYNHGYRRLKEMDALTEQLEEKQQKLKNIEGLNSAVTDTVVLLYSILMLAAGILLFQSNRISLDGVIIAFISMMSSFGPVAALSNLSNNLHHTIASGNRVLDLLEEQPLVNEISTEADILFDDIQFQQVNFSYDGKERIIDDVTFEIPKNHIIGIHGKSGTGKSTLLKLLMRFWKVDQGDITINKVSVEHINTSNLRGMESYVTQDTYLFNDTLAANIALGDESASMEAIAAAAKKASIHEFISSLPNGYQTKAGELGERLSGGEIQRIGTARAFLHNGSLILLDEPTSNLDSLNEAVILKSLKEECKDKTIVLVSHRKSTMNIADWVLTMESERSS